MPGSRLDHALKFSGDNRRELEKVLTRYSVVPADSLKYRSAVFLIENMGGHHFFEGDQMDNYTNYFRSLRENNGTPNKILDSLSNRYGRFTLEKIKLVYDLQVIDSAYLCENIDMAFQAWKGFPWSKNYSFEDFCEYILPYRLENEKLTNWRAAFLKKYKNIVNGIKSNDPIEVAKLLRDSVIHRLGNPKFTMTRPIGYPALDAFTAQQLAGSCDDLVQFKISLLRAFGIVCAKDYIPMQGAENFGHSWVSILDQKGEFYHTDFFDKILYVSDTIGDRTIMKTKVYRRTFSKNWDGLDKLRQKNVTVPIEFSENRYRFVDVTPLYSNNLTDLHLSKSELYIESAFPKVVYLCASSWQDWHPIAWSEFKGDGNVIFKNIDAGSILRIAYYDGSNIKFLSSPFFVHKQRRVPIFYPENSKKDQITLFSKFSIDREIWLRERMDGGRFEGANNADFKNPDTLYTIKKRPRRLYTEVQINTDKGYRYYRYIGADGSYCNISELEFISENGKLNGRIIGNKGAWNGDERYDYPAALDGRSETSYDHTSPSGGWAGIMIEKAIRVTRIRYAPRNYGNYIKEGHEYEFFVSTQQGWKSLGRKKALADSLVYSEVPIDGLFYLKDHTGGREERIFVLEDGKQVFK